MRRLTLNDLCGVPTNEALVLYYTQARNTLEADIVQMKRDGFDYQGARPQLERIEQMLSDFTARLPLPSIEAGS